MKSVIDPRRVADAIDTHKYEIHSPDSVPDLCRNVAAGLKGEGYTEQDFLDWMQLKQLPELPEGNSIAWSEADKVPACVLLEYIDKVEGGSKVQCKAYNLDVFLREIFEGAVVDPQTVEDALMKYDNYSRGKVTKCQTGTLATWMCGAARQARDSGADFYKAMYAELLFYVIIHSIEGRADSHRNEWDFLSPLMPGEPVIQ